MLIFIFGTLNRVLKPSSFILHIEGAEEFEFIKSRKSLTALKGQLRLDQLFHDLNGGLVLQGGVWVEWLPIFLFKEESVHFSDFFFCEARRILFVHSLCRSSVYTTLFVEFGHDEALLGIKSASCDLLRP